MKKRLLSLVSATVLSAVVLAGCGSQSGSTGATGAELKTGLGTSVSISSSEDATADAVTGRATISDRSEGLKKMAEEPAPIGDTIILK